jgi:hypothetical protein
MWMCSVRGPCLIDEGAEATQAYPNGNLIADEKR